MNIDRFEKLSENYGNLFIEVFLELGLDYEEFQRSVFIAVSKADPEFGNKAILDLGTGDGETLKAFVGAGCKKLTGLDLNIRMLEQLKKRFGHRVGVIHADIRKIPVQPKTFPIIISGEAIHNISKDERKKVWGEILRLKPEIFVNADKMVARTEKEHQQCYRNEVVAIKKVFAKRHGLVEASKEWMKHYEYDEKERLCLSEIEEFFKEDYKIKVVFEKGMQQTIVAIRK